MSLRSIATPIVVLAAWLALPACGKGGAGADAAPAPLENATRHPDMDHKACIQRKRPPRMFTVAASLKTSAESAALDEKGKAAGCVSGGNESFPPDKTSYVNIFCCP